jgi:hypothetical protein
MQILIDSEQKELITKMLELDIELRETQIKATKEWEKNLKIGNEYIPKIWELLNNMK